MTRTLSSKSSPMAKKFKSSMPIPYNESTSVPANTNCTLPPSRANQENMRLKSSRTKSLWLEAANRSRRSQRSLTRRQTLPRSFAAKVHSATSALPKIRVSRFIKGGRLMNGKGSSNAKKAKAESSKHSTLWPYCLSIRPSDERSHSKHSGRLLENGEATPLVLLAEVHGAEAMQAQRYFNFSSLFPISHRSRSWT